jgi:hypothetical protein
LPFLVHLSAQPIGWPESRQTAVFWSKLSLASSSGIR